MGLVAIKITISIIVVVLLAEVSKRVNPTLGGILSGVPLGAGLSVYFICYSEGIPFLLKGIPWGIAGLASSILFCFFYLIGGKIFEKSKYASIVISSILGFASFFISGYIVRRLSLGLISSTVIFTGAFILNIIYIRKIKIESDGQSIKKSNNTFLALLLRGVMVGLIIVAITGVASIVGSEWAGILSAFPSTLYSLLLVLHYEEGNNLYPSVIYGFSYSVSTLAVFYMLCWYILPIMGLNLGFVVIYAASLLYLYVFNKIKNHVYDFKNSAKNCYVKE